MGSSIASLSCRVDLDSSDLNNSDFEGRTPTSLVAWTSCLILISVVSAGFSPVLFVRPQASHHDVCEIGANRSDSRHLFTYDMTCVYPPTYPRSAADPSHTGWTHPARRPASVFCRGVRVFFLVTLPYVECNTNQL